MRRSSRDAGLSSRGLTKESFLRLLKKKRGYMPWPILLRKFAKDLLSEHYRRRAAPLEFPGKGANRSQNNRRNRAKHGF